MNFFTIFLASFFASGVFGEKTCDISPKMDLQIIVDSSGSVGLDHFNNMMKGIADTMIDEFEIGEEKTRAALFKFSSPDVMETEFRLNKYKTKEDVKNHLISTAYKEGATFTGNALEQALISFKEDERKEEDTAKLCFLFTDGNPTTPGQLEKAIQQAKEWADDGIELYVIGIGDGIMEDELIHIAGKEERVGKSDNFEEVGKVIKSQLKKVCKEELKEVPASFDLGQAGATSFLAGHSFDFAFRPGFPWANDRNTPLPQTVFYRFADPVKVSKFGFSSRNDMDPSQSPTEFNFVGSNDGQHWEILLHATTKFTKRNEAKIWDIPKDKIQKFSHYGIETLHVSSGPYVSIQNIQMWKLVHDVSPAQSYPVNFKFGQEIATSHLSGHETFKGFQKQNAGQLPWANPNTPSTQLPQTIYYRSPDPITVTKIAFSSRSDGYENQSPRKFDFVGSNDCNNWEIIMTVECLFSRKNEEQMWKIPDANLKTFLCHGIRTTKVVSGPHVAIQNLKMWKKEKDEDLVGGEVAFKAENEKSSSSLGGYGAQNAFVHQNKGKLPWANLNTAKFPHYLWYKMEEPTAIARFGFSSRTDGWIQQSPVEFDFIASNNCDECTEPNCAEWETLLDVQTLFTHVSEDHVWDVPHNKQKTFQCFGFRIKTVSSGIYAAIQNIMMWQAADGDCHLVHLDPTRAKASSTLPGYDVLKAFVHQRIGDRPWANLNTAKFPQTVFYRFQSEQSLCRFGFSSRRDGWLNQAPTSFELVGSNDCETWETIMTVETTTFTALDQEHVWEVPEHDIADKRYLCYGIKITKVTSGVYATLQNVKMWVKG